MPSYGAPVQGTANVSSVGTSAILASPGAGKRLHICYGTVSINTLAASATVALDDGTTTIWRVAASNVAQLLGYQIDFGDKGYQLGQDRPLYLTVAGGNADAFATFTGYSRGG